MDDKKQSVFQSHVARDEKRRLSLMAALRRTRAGKAPRTEIKANSEPWTSEPPRSVAEAIALSDRIEGAIRDWGPSR